MSNAITAAVAPVADAIVANIPPLADKPTWYVINKVKDAEDEAEISIYDEIGGWGISAEMFVRDLNDVAARRINVRLNTPGGDVFDGTAIHNALVRHPAQIVMHVDGVAASAGSFIAMAGDEIRMADNAYFMIHNAWGGLMGGADEMKAYASLLEKINGNIAQMYAAKTGKDTKHYRELMDAETWFTAEEAMAEGLVDTITRREGAAARHNTKSSFDFTVYNKIPDPVRRMWGLKPNQRSPEESPCGDPVPAIPPRKDSAMSEPNTEAPATVAAAPPVPAPAIAAAENRHNELVRLNAQAIEACTEQGRVKGVAEGRTFEMERAKAIVEVCKGKPEMAITAILAGQPPESVALAYDAAVAVENKAKEDSDRKDAEIARWQALCAIGGYPGGVPYAPTTRTEDDGRTGPLTDEEAKAQAAHEWDTRPAVRKTARSKEIYILARTAELDGTHRQFSREQAVEA
jgi:ATP-dependent Clp endopeptidase proteolytic subunit ClpP